MVIYISKPNSNSKCSSNIFHQRGHPKHFTVGVSVKVVPEDRMMTMGETGNLRLVLESLNQGQAH